MVLLFIGPSGSGKDTQAELLRDEYGFKIVSTGAVLRLAAMENSPEGNQITKDIEDGKFVADELMYRRLGNHLKDLDISKLILTGAVRREHQVELLDELLTSLGTKLDKVVYIDLSDEAAVERLANRLYCPVDKTIYHLDSKPPKVAGRCDKCGGQLIKRSDDYPEAIKERLAEFHDSNREILAKYEQRGQLLRVDGAPGIEEVHRQVVDGLGLA